jgi:hypothetical protein
VILRKDIREEETPTIETEKTGILGNKSTTKVKVKTKITEFVWKYEVGLSLFVLIVCLFD